MRMYGNVWNDISPPHVARKKQCLVLLAKSLAYYYYWLWTANYVYLFSTAAVVQHQINMVVDSYNITIPPGGMTIYSVSPCG